MEHVEQKLKCFSKLNLSSSVTLNIDVSSRYFNCISLIIIPRARVGHKMIDSQRGALLRVGYNHLISNKREWNNSC